MEHKSLVETLEEIYDPFSELEPVYTIEPDDYGWVVNDMYMGMAIAAFKRHEQAIAWAERHYGM